MDVVPAWILKREVMAEHDGKWKVPYDLVQGELVERYEKSIESYVFYNLKIDEKGPMRMKNRI